MSKDSPTYSKLSSEASTIVGDDDTYIDTFTLKHLDIHTTLTKRLNRLLLANITLFVLSLALLTTTLFLRLQPTTTSFVRKFSSYSPAAPAVKYVSGTFNATQGMASGYVGTSNETNEMWEWVTTGIGDQMITPDELKLVGKPETSVKATDPKSGREGYRIGLEVFHQLHCLNLVRKRTWGDVFKEDEDFKGGEEKVRGHVDHCLEMLRMNIMCQVDIGVITFHELADKPGDPYPDFSTRHVCRDFDAVRNWAIENTVANDDIF